MATISIIIPVYNVEEYLERCLQSVISQNYSDIEILLIDDGSTDRSPQICDSFAMKDNRVEVTHTMNNGVSVARNIGVKKAKGDYLMFVDSDDYLTGDAIETVFEYHDKYKNRIEPDKLCGLLVSPIRSCG